MRSQAEPGNEVKLFPNLNVRERFIPYIQISLSFLRKQESTALLSAGPGKNGFLLSQE
ncbi:Uncharacterized protein dnm_067650 [Desulfonema magnum]|uniref:Uncharacterized protein n=1 Tax=Desulfonema magnum TaxID=45655 RepID=A0A975GR83_9BACT|nr:Uncharacterized protein dnm_067650 [Desulfonema magnum]